MLGLSGIFAPIVTPFTDDGATVSEIRLARVVRHLLKSGVTGFVCTTETGEFTTISASERKQVLEIVKREAHGAIVLAHCTRLGTAQTLDLCQHATRHGAEAAVVMPPYFGQYSDEEIEQHIRSIVQHAGLPIIVVDPQHQLRTDLRERLKNLTELYHAETTEHAFRSRFAVDPIGSGSDEFALEEAVVSPLVQIDPAAALNPDADLHPLARMVAQHGRAQLAKAALSLLDLEVGPPRAPGLPLSHDLRRELGALIQTQA